MNIFVACSSSNEIDSKYLKGSKEILEIVFKEDNNLVFGAMNSGIMGLSYNIAKENKRKVIGIAPKKYKDDFLSLQCDEEIITDKVIERTEELVKNADIVLVLPGGIGTIHELFMFLEMKHSKETNIPIIICNLEDYFDKVIEVLNKIYKENFGKEKPQTLYTICNNKQDILSIMKNAI